MEFGLSSIRLNGVFFHPGDHAEEADQAKDVNDFTVVSGGFSEGWYIEYFASFSAKTYFKKEFS